MEKKVTMTEVQAELLRFFEWMVKNNIQPAHDGWPIKWAQPIYEGNEMCGWSTYTISELYKEYKMYCVSVS